MDEIQAYFDGRMTFDDLSNFAKLFVTNLNASNVTAISKGFGIVDRSNDEDPHGPFVRITWTIDALSGTDRRWVTVAELAEAVLADIHVAEWVTKIAGSSEPSELQRVITVMIDTWCSMLLTDEIVADFGIELSYDESGPVWRTIHRPNVERAGIEAVLIDHLVTTYGGTRKLDVEGRSQVSLDEFEVFLGRDSTADRSAFTLTERPLVASVLAGTELDGDRWRVVVEEWVNDPVRPAGFPVEIHVGTGHQVWVDRVLDGDALRQLDELIEHSRVLAEALSPWERA
jgi:hypothetical protein